MVGLRDGWEVRRMLLSTLTRCPFTVTELMTLGTIIQSTIMATSIIRKPIDTGTIS
jgi:hypothetical protein